MMDLLTGPHSYISGETFIDVNGNNIYENGIDTPIDTAVNYLGPLGIRIFPGAKNLVASSLITYINSIPGLQDPGNIIEARNYISGLDPAGQLLNPCTWAYGEVRGGVPCNEVNPYFWCSGNPIIDVGWISNQNRDIRGVGSAGPFTLVKNQEVEVLIGYEIDRSTTPLGGITAVRAISDAVQDFYENNFGYPIVSVEDEPPVVSNFKLEQNYPNPFNPSTVISYQLPVTGDVILKVYDVLGNEIATLVNEEKQPGVYEVEFDASSLASGMYLYKLQAGSFTNTKKMILMK
ncbi:MAG: T9SS type A sorting domain-containing protein [Ignavibacteriaceae bacterium]|nr:T9SS type A sorting domain-containing protein [Ignavibacteriaceae bacterium]